MKIITLCLLVLASGSCLLGKVESSPFNPVSFEEVQPFGDDGFIKTMEKILMKVLTTVQGVNCTIKEVIEVLIATTKYIDAIESCGTEIPKEIAKIVKTCRNIVDICNDIIHLKSTICANDEGSKMTSSKCFWGLFTAVMKLTRNIHNALHLMAKMPVNTEVCFVDATREVETSYNDFMPSIMRCIDQM